jgi:cytochrome c biogenesis protein CcdA/thiol-disulfide isomerase/thioredoxin
MILFTLSFIAGVLTVLAPCILPLLPVIIGGSLGVVGEEGSKRKLFVIVASLGLSVVLFTLLLKASTALINIPPYFWTWLSGGIVLFFGATLLFPGLWEKLPFIAKLSADSNKLVGAGYQKKSFWGDVLIGAALGPVFSTCSPTYFIVLATVLPQNIALGFVYLLAYTAGLCLMLLLIGLVGQRLADKLGVVADPRGAFKRTLGAIFIVVGLVVVTGWDKQIQIKLLDAGIFDITRVEQYLLQITSSDESSVAPNIPTVSVMDLEASTTAQSGSAKTDSVPTLITQTEPMLAAKKGSLYEKAPELVSVAGYVNTDGKPITLAQYKGNKVVLIDIWTYSCINCQRTLPYLKEWYAKYKDQGLEIVGVHTPEFAFERVQANVESAMKTFGVTWPVVLDNEYGTWNAFKNSYWPRKYLIDIDGYVVYDHAGEGNYEETEKAIQAALAERAKRLGDEMPSTGVSQPKDAITDIRSGSPEVYFGAWRNEYFGSGYPGVTGVQTFSVPKSVGLNILYFSGTWDIQSQYARTSKDAKFYYQYLSKAVYLVAGSEAGVEVEVLRDGAPLEKSFAGKDIEFKDGKSFVRVKENRLYKIIEDPVFGNHTLEFRAPSGLDVYTFTFG